MADNEAEIGVLERMIRLDRARSAYWNDQYDEGKAEEYIRALEAEAIRTGMILPGTAP